MPSVSDACRANARHCTEIADTARTPDDRSEFLSFAASWQRLADEIESNERLVAFLDELAASTPAYENADRKLDGLAEYPKSKGSLRSLTTAILSISSHFISSHFVADHFATPDEVTPQ